MSLEREQGVMHTNAFFRLNEQVFESEAVAISVRVVPSSPGAAWQVCAKLCRKPRFARTFGPERGGDMYPCIGKQSWTTQIRCVSSAAPLCGLVQNQKNKKGER